MKSAFTLLLAVVTMLTACTQQQSAADKGKGKKSQDPMTVQLVAAKPAAVRPVIRATGTIYATEDVVVSAKVPGRIIAVRKDLGDRVGPGETLAEIDRTDYELAARERELAVSATLAKLGLTAFPSTELKAEEVPTVRRTALQLANVRGKHLKLKTLFEQTPPLISEQEFLDSRTALEVAESEFNVELLNAKALLAEANTLQAEWSVANQKLRDATATSPRRPVTEKGEPVTDLANPDLRYAIAERLVTVGEYVREGAPLFRLIDDDPVKLRAMVPERYVGQIGKESAVKVKVQAHASEFSGAVHRISPQVDPASRAFTVEVLIANPDSKLKPGSFASATIELPVEQPAVSVPASAVASFAGVNKVFVIKDNKAVEKRVELGEKQGDQILIHAGLAAGDQVVLSPPSQMVTGTPVNVSGPTGAAE